MSDGPYRKAGSPGDSGDVAMPPLLSIEAIALILASLITEEHRCTNGWVSVAIAPRLSLPAELTMSKAPLAAFGRTREEAKELLFRHLASSLRSGDLVSGMEPSQRDISRVRAVLLLLEWS
jgi:hypothetical protein